jgi:large subunit ribosomal protein L4|tara:strand:+ start:2077 stop:2715 length:639 start_codon:yes stop_codon:yes gene_type:complete
MAGEVVKHIEISDDVFAVPFNQAVVHQAMVRQLANTRQGTATTKTRGEVSGSHQKLFRQKGTGLARAGSRRSPLRRGGGVAFGPKPRNYRQEMPKKMRQLALRSVLSAKAGDKELVVLEKLELDETKTKEVVKILAALGMSTSSALITTSQPEEKVVKSARNLVGVKTIPAKLLNVVDLLSHKMLLMTETAVRQVEQLWGKGLVKGENNASL